MAEVLNFFNTYMPVKVGITDFIEIAILSFLFYQVLLWIKRTKAWTLFKGILVLLGFIVLASILQLNTILWLANKTLSVGIIAIIIIFQPELRKALERIGQNNIFKGFFNFEDSKKDENNEISEKTITELVKATYELAKTKTGALMVIEREISLEDYERTGIEVDAIVTSQLLVNIFEHNTPLHDGAIVIRANRVTSATCYLPLSDNMGISKELGTRHRAGLGASEATDAFVLIVSEETGKVSVANNGNLTRDVDGTTLKEMLLGLRNNNVENKKFKIWKGKHKDNEEKAD
ncbi:MAG: TIGR00159 family protein [Lachnospiraceae bacterium]|nr:TIGR00159 family protein [Lachnospiraceae bacterium]